MLMDKNVTRKVSLGQKVKRKIVFGSIYEGPKGVCSLKLLCKFYWWHMGSFSLNLI